jgi:ubiquinone/menaquinone biosynthesis C-methylase UbiE
VTRLLVEAGASVRAYERAAPMLEVAREQLPGIAFELADARALPAESASADVVVAGWVFGHLRLWMPDGWQAEVGACLAEAERVLVPGGRIVIIETLGTGRTVAAPPSEALAEYYAFLEVRGFSRSDVSTDYAFASPDEAADVLGGFFGPDMAERIRREGWARVPEWTGIWAR